jgi:cytochrome c oxidase subunit II
VSPTDIYSPATTPAQWIIDLSMMVYAITGAIFVVVCSLLVYSIVKFRQRKGDDRSEPAQVYGSTQIELAWTIIPILIVVVLFLATARAIAYTQNAKLDDKAVEVIVVGHQFWWEYRYPGLGIVTANELHVPVSDAARSRAPGENPRGPAKEVLW